jgi:hydrogenase maturation protease
MTPRPVVAALGQAAGGDDGVGHAVLEELRRRGAEARADLVSVPDPLALLALMHQGAPLVVVDAVVASPPGVVMELAPHMLADRQIARLSSHTLSLGQALDLAAALAPPGATPAPLHIIAVGIDTPVQAAEGLSPAVAAAVPAAAARVLDVLEHLPG